MQTFFSSSSKGLSSTMNSAEDSAKRLTNRGAVIANQINPTLINNALPSQVIVRNYYHRPFFSSPMWYPMYDPMPIYYPSRSRGGQDSENAMRTLVAIVSVVVLSVSSYIVGSSIVRIQDTNKAIEDVRDDQSNLHLNLLADSSIGDVLRTAYDIGELQVKVYNRIQHSAWADLILNIGLVFSSTIALLGAFAVVNPSLIPVGMLACAAIGVAILIKKGVESSHSTDMRDAALIRSRIDHFNAQKRSLGKDL